MHGLVHAQELRHSIPVLPVTPDTLSGWVDGQPEVVIHTVPDPTLGAARLRIGPDAVPPNLRSPEAPRALGAERVVQTEHPVLRGVALAGMVARSVPAVLPSEWTVLAAAGDLPLVLVREVPGQPRELLLPFSPAETDLVLRRAFPLRLK